MRMAQKRLSVNWTVGICRCLGRGAAMLLPCGAAATRRKCLSERGAVGMALPAVGPCLAGGIDRLSGRAFSFGASLRQASGACRKGLLRGQRRLLLPPGRSHPHVFVLTNGKEKRVRQ